MNKYVTCIFGDRYNGMLASLVESIVTVDSSSDIQVFWQDMDLTVINAMRMAYPRVNFFQTNFDFTGDRVARISSKTLMWNFAIAQQQIGDLVCIVDVDVLIVKSPFYLLHDNKPADLIITAKNEQFRLNSGVILLNINKGTRLFFLKWKEQTISVLKDPQKLYEASSINHHYGGPDQMSLYQMINYEFGQTTYALIIDDSPVTVRAIPTYVLNETNSCPISEFTHIIHYKGGWQSVILCGQPFPETRSQSASMPMYLYFMKVYMQAASKLMLATGNKTILKRLNIVVPLWFKYNGTRVGCVFYKCTCTKQIILNLLRRYGHNFKGWIRTK